MYTWMQRLSSFRHRLWYRISERVRWSRGAFVEAPAGSLPDVSREQGERIAALREAYQVQFEARLSVATALKNYEYLDVLRQLAEVVPMAHRRGGVLHDVGCASFGYVAALDVFFAPDSILGVEVEGYRLFQNGHTRIDYATGYLEAYPHAHFKIADYSRVDATANIILAWFPFVSPGAILAWRLPLTLLAPLDIFVRVRRNLCPGGVFIMINHGLEEAREASALCLAAGMQAAGELIVTGPLMSHRLQPAVASCWVAA